MLKHYNFVLKEEEEDWQGEEFCIKVLCEHEEVIIQCQDVGDKRGIT